MLRRAIEHLGRVTVYAFLALCAVAAAVALLRELPSILAYLGAAAVLFLITTIVHEIRDRRGSGSGA